MTRAEALAEAKRRWGPDGHVSYGMIHGYRVGTKLPSATALMDVKGSAPHLTKPRKGRNGWVDAFADADRRAK